MRVSKPQLVIKMSEDVARGDVLALSAYIDLLMEEGHDGEVKCLLQTIAQLMLQPDDPSFTLLMVYDHNINQPMTTTTTTVLHKSLHCTYDSAMVTLREFCVKALEEEGPIEMGNEDPVKVYFDYWLEEPHECRTYKIDEVKLRT